MSDHAEYGDFLQELFYVLLCWSLPSMNHDITMPSSPKSNNTFSFIVMLSNEIFSSSSLKDIRIVNVLPESKFPFRKASSLN